MSTYDTTTLLEVQRQQKVPKPFWLRFFTRQINFTTDQIAFDRVSEDYRRLAPFVAPNVQGKVLTTEGYDTLFFKPAYAKPKHVIDIDTPFIRQPGEALGTGSLTPQQRKDAKIAEILGRHKAMHTMTQEWMAAQAIIHASVTVKGDNYPTTTVNFQRDPSLSITLLGTAQWDDTGADPLGDIYDARRLVNDLTAGAVVRDLIFGVAAWDLFRANPKVEKLLDTQIRGSETNLTALNDGFEDSVEFLGELKGVNGAGHVRLWLYTGKYIDEANVKQDMMPADYVVGVADSVEGHRCFGAIKDGAAGFQALEMFPKQWIESNDPWQEMLMTQSAPLMVPKQPNATFRIKVT